MHKVLAKALAAVVLTLGLLFAASACDRKGDAASGGGGKKPLIGVSFDTLQTEYWVASRDALEAEIKARGAEMLIAVANNDAARQLEQVNNFITKGVTGIIIAPKDAQAVVPAIKAANRAKIPIVLYNRPPADNAGKSVTIVADNREITKATVTHLVELARKAGRKHKALILVGDLGDVNAIGRRDGFDDVVKASPDVITGVVQVPTEWNQEKALAGVTNALQDPDISLIFSSSDFLFPSVVSALKQQGRYKKVGEPGHVLLAGFDGDATAYQMLVDGYLDADGVQDVYFECKAAVAAVFDLRDGKDVPPLIRDPGLVIHQGNLAEAKARMWGANVKKAK